MGVIVVVTTIVVAGGWVWVDRRSMAVNVEHYDWEGWERVGLVGGYAAAVLWGWGGWWLGFMGGFGGGVGG